MKSLIIFIIMFIPFQLNSQWVTVNPIPDPVPNQNYFSVHFIDSLNGWAAGNRGVIVHTTNGGFTWFQQESGLSSTLRKIRFTDLQHGWAVGDSGSIIHTTNGGENWELQNSTPGLYLYSLSVIDPEYAYVAGKWGTPNQDILLHTSTGGASWGTLSFRFDLVGEKVTDMIFTDRNKGWYSTWKLVDFFTGGVGGAVYYTNNGGQSWIKQHSFHVLISLSPKSSVYFADALHGWCVGDWGVAATTNGGSTWSKRGNFPDFSSFSHVYFVDNNIGWLAENLQFGTEDLRSNAIPFSSDGGFNWSGQHTTSSYNVVYDLSFVENRIGWITVANTFNNNGYLLHTTNGGGVFPSPPEIIYPPDNQIVSSDTVSLIWNSSDSGIVNYELNISEDSLFQTYLDTLVTDTSFTYMNPQTNKFFYWRVRASNDIGWGGYSRVGLFNTIITSLENSSENQFNFSLSQNYPNPFNPSTNISWQSPVGSWQTLKVYDVLGMEVATLADEYRSAGHHEVEFNSKGLASGIYYYQLRINAYVETKKMILIR